MARFHPPRVSREAMYGEKQVFERLRQLDDSWIVLHSVHFTYPTRNGARLGEADFVLLHPRHGMLVLEIKDARYRVAARVWYRQPRSGGEVADKSPFEQAEQNRHKITDLLKDAGVRRVPIGHGVLFTAGTPSGPLGPDAPSQIVLNLTMLDDARAAIDGVIRHWNAGSWQRESDFATAIQALSPQAQVQPSLDYDVDVSLGELDRLTNTQVELTVRQLQVVRAMSQNSAALILGAAGTGKTFVAYEYARRMVAENHRVGVVGTPKQLRLVTRRSMASQGVVVGDLFDLLHSVYSEAERAPFADQTAWEQAIQLVEQHGPRLDTLLVDEAQSLDSDVLAVLGELLTTDGQLVLLADPYQLDSAGMWRPEGTFKEHWLTENCRNALPVAKLVARVSGSMAPGAGAPGPMPRLTAINPAESWFVPQAIEDDLRALGPGKVVVLTRSDRAANRMLELLRKAKLPVGRRIRDGIVPIFTVDEFRGCEAEAVIYVADRLADGDLRMLNYLATSRACAYLHILGDPTEWAAYDFLLQSKVG